MLPDRAADVAALDAAAARAVAGDPVRVAVVGPLGIGRSALLDVAAEVATGRRLPVRRAAAGRLDRDLDGFLAGGLPRRRAAGRTRCWSTTRSGWTTRRCPR